MVEEIKAKKEEMEDVYKLHLYIQKIKGKQSEVKTQVKQLQELFDHLDKKITEVSNAQKPSKKNMDEMSKPKSDPKDGKK